MRPISSLLGVLVACGGITAEHPLTIPLGVSREAAAAELRRHQYCRAELGPPQQRETFPRCDRAGAEWGESWVTARFEGDALVELRRYERFSDDARAVERWNQLVAERARTATGSPEAARALATRLLEPGTRSVKAFRVDGGTLVGIYLLTPSPPEQASVLEAVMRE